MDVDAVNTALESALATIAANVHGYLPDQVRPPAIVLALGDGTYDEDWNGSMSARWVAHVIVSRADTRNAQARVREYVAATGADSVKAAVESDPTLGGACGNVRVDGWDVPGEVEIGDTNYVMVSFDILVDD